MNTDTKNKIISSLGFLKTAALISLISDLKIYHSIILMKDRLINEVMKELLNKFRLDGLTASDENLKGIELALNNSIFMMIVCIFIFHAVMYLLFIRKNKVAYFYVQCLSGTMIISSALMLIYAVTQGVWVELSYVLILGMQIYLFKGLLAFKKQGLQTSEPCPRKDS